MDTLNIQFGEISFSSLSEKATVLHAPIVEPTYRNPLNKLISDASSPATVNRKQAPTSLSWVKDKGLSDDEEKKEHMRFAQVKRKKDFVHYERVDGKIVNVVEECNIVFGSSLKILNHGIGEFFGPVSVPLPVGSVLVLQGNGADVAKHCVPRVSSKRISITFRRMDESKLPYNYKSDPELMRIQPIVLRPPQFKESSTLKSVEKNEKFNHNKPQCSSLAHGVKNHNILTANEEFPRLSKALVLQARTQVLIR
nr:RNA demethylase ALKBH5-like [Ipomoea batatas]